MWSEAASLLMQILFLFNILFTFVIIFFEKRNPAVTWAWLMVVLFLPYFGFVIYLTFGLDSRKHKTFSIKARQNEQQFKEMEAQELEGLAFLKSQKKEVDVKNFLHLPGSEHLNDLLYLNFVSGNGFFTQNNELTLFHEGNSKFNKLFEDIRGAKTFIHMQYYIFRDDNLGREIIALLAEKAKEGVEVKLFIDGMGNTKNSKKLYKPLLEAGGELGIFMPPHFVRINFRNHRKMCIIDGYIGYIGGFNVGDEYLGKVKKFGFWRDTHLRIVGNAAKELEIRFMLDWNFVSHNKLHAMDQYFPVIEKTNDSIGMQIVASGPDTKWSSVFYGYSKMISEADKSIYIETPYFAPDDSIFVSLKIAALSGIDVRIIIPANPDHPFVYWCSLSYLGELLDAGVKCYKYKKGFIHSKLLLIDGLVSSTGTANMDIRSFKLNFEINAFIYDRTIGKEFEQQFFTDLKDCEEITIESYSRRSAWQKIKEAFSRLLSPLL